MKYMGLNSASKFIKDMIDSAESTISEWENGTTYNMLQEYNKITFKIITIILFGKDVNEKLGTLDFVNPDDSIKKIPFSEFYIKICKDVMSTSQNLIGLFFPIVASMDLVKPFSTNRKNVDHMQNKLRNYLRDSDDNDSVFSNLVNIEKLDKEEVLQDLLGFLFAGHETSSHLITSSLYFISKNPETQKKLKEELKELRGKPIAELKEILTKDKINEFTYLYQVVKETLRVDPPANETIPYECVKDVEMCGVSIKKGQLISVNLLSRHYNPNQWKDSKKFIPERFDPESEYYSTPEGKRNPLSWIPFSINIRNCPGQTLAILETKLCLIHFLSRTDYKIDQATLDNDCAYFSVISQLQCEFKPQKYY